MRVTAQEADVSEGGDHHSGFPQTVTVGVRAAQFVDVTGMLRAWSQKRFGDVFCLVIGSFPDLLAQKKNFFK